MKLMAIGLGIAAWVEGSICQTTFLSNAALRRPTLTTRVPKDTREK